MLIDTGGVDVAKHPRMADEERQCKGDWWGWTESAVTEAWIRPPAATGCIGYDLQMRISWHPTQVSCIDTHGASIIAMIVSLQRRLDQHSDGDREREFFAHVLQYLTTSSGLRVELKNWMITSYEVEFGPNIGSGGLWVHFFSLFTGSEFAPAGKYF